MRNHVCPDCSQLVTGDKWAGHVAKHGRLVPDPHARSVIAGEEGDDSAAQEQHDQDREDLVAAASPRRYR